MNTFGDKISYLRKDRQKTQEEVAAATGTTKSTISKYERNLVDPTLESAKKIANYFMVSLDWLAGNITHNKKNVDSIENNSENNIELIIPQSYIDVIKKAVSQDVTANNLNDALTFILKLRKS